MLGKIYSRSYNATELSAGNFKFSTCAATTASTKNTYNNYTKLPLISKHIPKHKSQLTLTELGYFLSQLGLV